MSILGLTPWGYVEGDDGEAAHVPMTCLLRGLLGSRT